MYKNEDVLKDTEIVSSVLKVVHYHYNCGSTASPIHYQVSVRCLITSLYRLILIQLSVYFTAAPFLRIGHVAYPTVVRSVPYPPCLLLAVYRPYCKYLEIYIKNPMIWEYRYFKIWFVIDNKKYGGSTTNRNIVVLIRHS